MKIRNVEQVAIWRLCIGCGACIYACPENNIKLVNFISDGIRPVVNVNNCKYCSECLKVCPGYETSHSNLNESPNFISQLMHGWGPIFEIWEGYATDTEIRYSGSSGGLATSLAMFCIEQEGMEGVLHIGSDPEQPLKNKTFFSKSKEELLLRTGSRYSPASPCDSLGQIESAMNPSVFIGKPCDVRALRKAQSLRKKLDNKVGLAIGIFCAGSPSTQATIDLLKLQSKELEPIDEIRYRGQGWPGMFTVREKGEKVPSATISYRKSWAFLQAYRPFCCYLCPDGTSEFADISCGDPWYREIQKDDLGFSLVLVRTEKGRRILHHAREAGYIHLSRIESKILKASQENLLRKRRAIWGRLVAMKAFGIPNPKLKGFYLFKNWRQSTFLEKIRSIFGTIKRIILRKYTRPLRF